LLLIQSIMIDSKRVSFEASFDQQNLVLLRKLPFFVMGSSMGGALSMMVAHELTKGENKELYSGFQGAILLAPALKFNVPNPVLVETLR
jgi:alpha-beta hydrolase superfamily lysophospholipase